MRKDYDDVKDEHVGHTEEDPDPFCLLCKKRGWVEDQEQEEKEEVQESEDSGSDLPDYANEASGYVKNGVREEMRRTKGL